MHEGEAERKETDESAVNVCFANRPRRPFLPTNSYLDATKPLLARFV